MLIHRILTGILVLSSLAAAGEARAICLDPSSCICPGLGETNVTFAGTIMKHKAGEAQFQVRLDTLSLVGPRTDLQAGGIVSFDVKGAPGTVIADARVIGFSTSSCVLHTEDCDDATFVEELTLTQISTGHKTFMCNGTELKPTADEIAVSMAGGDCGSDIRNALEDEGVDTGCCDTCAIRPGPVPSTGWAGLLGIPALIARRRLRRASSRRS